MAGGKMEHLRKMIVFQSLFYKDVSFSTVDIVVPSLVLFISGQQNVNLNLYLGLYVSEE